MIIPCLACAVLCLACVASALLPLRPVTKIRKVWGCPYRKLYPTGALPIIRIREILYRQPSSPSHSGFQIRKGAFRRPCRPARS